MPSLLPADGRARSEQRLSRGHVNTHPVRVGCCDRRTETPLGPIRRRGVRLVGPTDRVLVAHQSPLLRLLKQFRQ